MSNGLFYGISISFITGVMIGSFFDIDLILTFLILIISIGVLIHASIYFSKSVDNPFSAGITSVSRSSFAQHSFARPIFTTSLFLIALSVGLIRIGVAGGGEHLMDENIGQTVALSGTVCAEPEKKELTQRIRFCPNDHKDKIIITAPRYPEYDYGDSVHVTGKLELPENFETYEGGPVFDYVSYLEKDGIRYRMARPEISIKEKGRGNRLVATLINLKGSFMDNVERAMPEPHASLVAGILLGEKAALPQDVSDAFRRTGLTHILVLSGSNVTVVAEALIRSFSFLPRVMGLWCGSLSIILFAIMTGASATTVRATTMALVVILAKGSGRRYDVARALCLAAIIMLMENPMVLAFDIGFQLSFIATLALIYVSPIVSTYIRFIPESFQFREIISTSISTQIFILPFVLYSMGEISIISLVTNLLVLPLVPLSMFGGFVAGMAGFINISLATIVSFPATAILSWMVYVVSFFGPMPFATAKAVIGPWTLFLSYFLYICILVHVRRRRDIL